MTLASQDYEQMFGAKSEMEGVVWRGLLQIGGIAALLAGLVFRRNLGAELTLLKEVGLITDGPAAPPTTIRDWFALLQSDPLVGLTWLDVFDLMNYILLGLMFLALVVMFRRVNPSGMGIAAGLGLIGIVIYFAMNQAFALLSLSQQYGAAGTAMQRSALLTDGQTLLTINRFGSPGRTLSLLFIASACLLTSFVMLRSIAFSRATAYVGILAATLDLAYCLGLALLPPVDREVLGMCFIPAAGLFWMMWHILIGQRLYRQGRLAGKTQQQL